jgi:hypothetical protein
MVLTFIMSERQLPDVKPNEQLNIAIWLSAFIKCWRFTWKTSRYMWVELTKAKEVPKTGT